MTKRILSLCCAVCLTAVFSACSNTSEITETSAASYENSTTMPQIDENESETETKTEASVTEETEQSDEPIETKSNDEYEYWVYDDHISICEYLGSDSEVIVPAEIDGLPVTVLEEYAFGGNETLTRVELPDSLITIGVSAFAFCKNLKSVVIPENVSEIGEEAFYSCESLESVSIPKNVSEIGEDAFI
ncbi:MAG: leucine-rich repeat domain-containing protein, partial [Oscillospiraceae bacterium]|nr:leucine-rich repeat domain-containing protein [Oscillospiraceae bacterium]